MRLIDADLLLSSIDKRYNEKVNIAPDNLAEGFDQMEKLIKEQPTAYDIDGVVEQLKRCYGIVRSTSINYAEGLKDAYERAIEIVKAGGKDE